MDRWGGWKIIVFTAPLIGAIIWPCGIKDTKHLEGETAEILDWKTEGAGEPELMPLVPPHK